MTDNHKRFKKDQRQQALAWGITVGIHLIILCIPMLKPETTLSINKTKHYQIPVEIMIRKPSPPPPKPAPPKKTIQQPKKKTTKRKKTLPQKTKKTPAISYPNDQSQPSILSHITPVYPKSALNEGLTGKVVVDFTINTNGKPIKHKLIKSSGHTILDNSFIQTVLRYYTFKPKQEKGEKKVAIIRLDSGDAFEL